jgi:hypothetical protein
MGKKKELTKYEEGVIKKLNDANDKYISQKGKRTGIGQVAFCKKHPFSQSFYSGCLNKIHYLKPSIILAVAEETGIHKLTLDSEYYNPKRWERPKNQERKGIASEGHILYILEQPNRDVGRPIAKIGITNNLSQRIKTLNSSLGVSDTWSLYVRFDLGLGHAFDVEKATKKVLTERYESRKTEVFYCEPSQILGAVTGVISKNKDCIGAVYPEEISDRLQEEFDELVWEREVLLESEGYPTSWWN